MYEPWTRILAVPARTPEWRRVAGIVAAIAALVVAIVAVITVVDPASGAGARTVTLQARSVLYRVQVVDSAPAGKSAGDAFVFTEELLDDRGRQVGSDAAYCTRLFDTRLLCSGAYTLEGGQVLVSLVQPDLAGALTYAQAITGGTGRYAGAIGTVLVRQQPGGDRFTFRIRLPRAG